MTRWAIKLLLSATLLLAAFPTAAQETLTVRIQVSRPDGAPAASAPVAWAFMPYTEKPRTTLPGENERAVTDADGFCTLQLPKIDVNTGDTYEVWVDGGESLAAFFRVSQSETRPDPLPIRLEKQVPVRGRVRAQDGSPVAGALVGHPCFPRTTTDGQGQFTLWGTGTWGSNIAIFKEGFAWTLLHSAKGELDIVLEPGTRLTIEAVDADGKPLRGATIHAERDSLVTDDHGRGMTLPLARGTSVNLLAQYGEADQRLVSESTNATVSGAEGQVARLVLTPYVAPDPVTISGRVLMAETGEPVRARIFTHYSLQDFDYGADEEGHTEDDGSFTLTDHTRRDLYIQVLPTKSTLYGSDGIVRVDCSNGSVEGLELKVAQGCAVSGRIVLSDTAEPAPTWIMLRQGETVRQFFAKESLFQFFNLPPSPSDVYLESDGITLPIMLGGAGTALRDVTLNLPGPSATAHLKGRIVNREGEPQPGYSVSFSIQSDGTGLNYVSADSNGDGQFVIETKFAGTVSLDSVRFTRQVATGGQNDRRQIECSILQPLASFSLQPDASIDTLTIVAEAPSSTSISGTIQDEHGKPLKPEIQFLTGEWKSDAPRELAGEGVFQFYTLPDERFAIIFVLKGYQVRILEEGRDFERGNQELQVVLPTTPYPDDVPLWTTITGAPWTAEAVEQSIQGDSIRRRFYEFQQLLAPVPPTAITSPPVTAPVTDPTSIPVRVVDASGAPVTRISLQPMAYYGHFEDRLTPNALDVLPEPGAAAVIRTNPEGNYDLPLHHLIWAEGTCRQLTGRAPQSGEVSPRIIKLSPGKRLTVQVRGHDGNPLPGIGVAPYTPQGNLRSSGAMHPYPTTDSTGTVVFEQVPPGIYTLIVYLPMQEHSGRLAQADLTANDKVTIVVDFGSYPADSGDALLEELRRAWQMLKSERSANTLADLWEKRTRKDRKRIQDSAIARLAAPVLADISALHFLADLAIVANMKSSVPDLMRNIAFLPDNARWQDGPAIINALADLAGNDAITYLTQAMNPTLGRDNRLAMIVALNRIGTPESLAAWQSLRDGARSFPNAPQPQAAYTHEERMVEAMRLVLGYLAGAMPEPPLTAGSPEVDADYLTGRVHIGNTEYHMRRYGDEWVLIEIGTTVME